MSVVHFLKYNNALPIALSLVLLSTSGALAASPAVRAEAKDLLYTKQERVIGVDNTYIIGTDMESYEPTVRVTSITEDEGAYYVAYELGTIGVEQGVWQEVTKEDTVVVPKTFLTELNLGQHLSRYFEELVTKEKRLLIETRDIEVTIGATSRTVTTEYRGLIGEFFEPELRALPGYVPPEPSEETPQLDGAETQDAPSVPNNESEGTTEPTGTTTNTGYTPTISLIGDNPFTHQAQTPYAELGVIVDDIEDGPNGIVLTIEGDIDIETPGTYLRSYTATDRDGNTRTVSREVIVVAGETPTEAESPAASDTPEPPLDASSAEETTPSDANIAPIE